MTGIKYTYMYTCTLTSHSQLRLPDRFIIDSEYIWTILQIIVTAEKFDFNFELKQILKSADLKEIENEDMILKNTLQYYISFTFDWNYKIKYFILQAQLYKVRVQSM